jgi:hypothetical protein
MEATRNTSLEKQYTLPKHFLGDSVRPKGHEEERSLPSFLGGFRILSKAMKAKRPPKLPWGGFSSSWKPPKQKHLPQDSLGVWFLLGKKHRNQKSNPMKNIPNHAFLFIRTKNCTNIEYNRLMPTLKITYLLPRLYRCLGLHTYLVIM